MTSHQKTYREPATQKEYREEKYYEHKNITTMTINIKTSTDNRANTKKKLFK